MAQHIGIFKYGDATVNDSKNGGWQGFAYSSGVFESIPVIGTVFHSVSPAQTIGNFTINSIVEILPTGLNLYGKKYFCDSTASVLNTAANA